MSQDCVAPESVVDHRSLVELVSRVEQLSGDDGGVAEAGGLTAHLLTVDQDVLSMGSDGGEWPSLMCDPGK